MEQPFIPSENHTLILQESFTSPVGSYVIYAATDTTSMNVAIRGEDSKELQILPSGFVVCSKGQPNVTLEETFNNGNSSVDGSGGTLLTLAYQILTSSTNGIDKPLNMESVATVNTLLSNTILKVKEALMTSTT